MKTPSWFWPVVALVLVAGAGAIIHAHRTGSKREMPAPAPQTQDAAQPRPASHAKSAPKAQTMQAPKPAPTPAIVADVDGDSFISLVYSNLPLSKVVLVRASSGEEFDVDDNVQGSGGAEFTETNKPAGTYYLKAVAHGTGAEVARTAPFYLNTRP